MYVGFSLYLGLMFSLMKQYHRRLREKPLKLETLSGKLRTKEANSRFPSFARTRKTKEFSLIAIGEKGQGDSREVEETG